jgi:hypothetical protein
LEKILVLQQKSYKIGENKNFGLEGFENKKLPFVMKTYIEAT